MMENEMEEGNTECQLIIIRSETAITFCQQNIFGMRSNVKFIFFPRFFKRICSFYVYCIILIFNNSDVFYILCMQ